MHLATLSHKDRERCLLGGMSEVGGCRIAVVRAPLGAKKKGDVLRMRNRCLGCRFSDHTVVGRYELEAWEHRFRHPWPPGPFTHRLWPSDPIGSGRCRPRVIQAIGSQSLVMQILAVWSSFPGLPAYSASSSSPGCVSGIGILAVSFTPICLSSFAFCTMLCRPVYTFLKASS